MLPQLKSAYVGGWGVSLSFAISLCLCLSVCFFPPLFLLSPVVYGVSPMFYMAFTTYNISWYPCLAGLTWVPTVIAKNLRPEVDSNTWPQDWQGCQQWCSCLSFHLYTRMLCVVIPGTQCLVVVKCLFVILRMLCWKDSWDSVPTSYKNKMSIIHGTLRLEVVKCLFVIPGILCWVVVKCLFVIPCTLLGT